MGNFYTNLTVRGPEQHSVVDYLNAARRSAFVSPVSGDCLVVYDEQSEGQDPEILCGLASGLSQSFECAGLAVLNHDDDFLLYWLYECGELTEEFQSSGGVMSGLRRRLFGGAPRGGKLCLAFGCSLHKKVEGILGGPYLYAVDRHEALTKALGIPYFGVGIGFNDILRDPVGFLGEKESARFVRTGVKRR